MISMVIAGDILEDNDDTELSRAGGDGRIGGVYDTLGFAAPILRLLSYLVGIVCTRGGQKNRKLDFQLAPYFFPFS